MEKDLPSVKDEDPNIPISAEDTKKISDAYYIDLATYGRDALYHYLKTKHGKDTPSRRTVMRWLSRQKLQQEFAQTRKGGTTNYFIPVSPFHALQVDLIDFNYKETRSGFRYIIVTVDNFSRKVWTKAITSKTASATARGMKNVFSQIEKDHGEEAIKKIKYIMTDDGPEFKGEYDKLLKNMEIPRRRSLGGTPQQQGMVERANGKIKMLMAKYIKINGGSWIDQLENATKGYNNQLIRTTEYTPNEAMGLAPEDYDKLITNVKEKQNQSIIVKKGVYKVGDKVRLKLNKGVLGKSSTANWSDDVYEVGEVIRNNNPVIADKYRIVGRAQDQLYSRNDLQQIHQVEEIPKKVSRQAQAIADDMLRVDQDSIAEGTFTRSVLEEKEEQLDKDYPDNFAEGAEKTDKQLDRLAEEAREADTGPKVKKPTRQRKQVQRLDPSKLKSDSEIRGTTNKKQKYTIEYLVDVRGKGKDKEYLVKWEDYAEPTWTREYIDGKRNIAQKAVKAFNDVLKYEQSPQKTSEPIPVKSLPKRSQTLTFSDADKRRNARKLVF